ncbi:MAG: alpha/beta-type small acid-soluble spore protein [Firmicutes bacterium]|jgi:hypothetical protein|nr:alpha/beta-type small acid-soluble spore protein [Bacillota bacterium]
MAKGRHVYPKARAAMERFKEEVADEMGLLDKANSIGWDNMTTKEAGLVGGEMVRRLIKKAEKDLET